MFKKYFVPILQTLVLVMAIAVSFSYSFSDDDGPFPSEDPNGGGYSCPGVAGCQASGCSGKYVKSCTYTPTYADSCPDKTQCHYRF